jgi:hypothetical protein
MFKALARLDARRRHMVPEVAPVHYPVHHNDNRSDRRRANAPARPPRLTCHWRAAPAGGRLECHWQIEPVDEASAETPGPSFTPGQMPAARRSAA